MTEVEHNVSRTADGLSHFNTLQIPVVWIRLFDPFHVPMPGAPYRVTLGTNRSTGQADEDAWFKIRCLDPSMPCTVEWGKREPEEGTQLNWDPGPSDPQMRLIAPGKIIDLTVQAGAAEPAPGRALDGRAEQDQDPAPDSEPDDGAKTDSASDAIAPPGQFEPPEFLYTMEVHLDLMGHDSEESIHRRLHNLGFDWYEDAPANIKAFQRIFDKDASGVMTDIVDSLVPWHDDCEPELWKAPAHADLSPIPD